MATKSPTTSVKSREMIGGDQFSQRREVFDKHDTVFLPLPSPTGVAPVYKEVDPIITSNHGVTTSNFKRNTPGYSSMRETRSEGRTYEYRPRKYSDNFTSDLNQSDDVDYRQTMIDRSRRLSKLRREFLNSNLHNPSPQNTLTRSGVRASMPTNSVAATRYKFENISVYKFPFAEPYSTPTPVRRVIVDLGSPNEGTEKENEDPQDSDNKPKHQSLPNDNSSSPKVDHQKLFEDLVKRYSPQRKPIDWTLPPTRPKVVGSVPKSTSSATDSVDSYQKEPEQSNNVDKDEVFEDKENNKELDNSDNQSKDKNAEEIQPNVEILHNGTNNHQNDANKDRDSKNSLIEREANDYVPELSSIKRQLSKEGSKKGPLETVTDLTIPDLLEKMTNESEQSTNKKDGKKVKRKRSFLDKLLGRKKEIKSEK